MTLDLRCWTALLAAVPLAGCLFGANETMHVFVNNETRVDQSFHLEIHFGSARGAQELYDGRHTVAAGGVFELHTVERPSCRNDGDLVLELELGNGTRYAEPDHWRADTCGRQGIRIELRPEDVDILFYWAE